MSNVVDLKKPGKQPLEIIGGDAPGKPVVSIQFNRALTPAEWDFFYETCQRTAFLMRGLKDE
jgi:hypothetical protein